MSARDLEGCRDHLGKFDSMIDGSEVVLKVSREKG